MLLQQNLFGITWTAKVFVKSTNRNLLDKVLLDRQDNKIARQQVYLLGIYYFPSVANLRDSKDK